MSITKNETEKKLSRKELRALERKFGVYFDKPVDAMRCAGEQIGVYDENEKHAGDICAKGMFFTADELRKKVKKLFGKAVSKSDVFQLKTQLESEVIKAVEFSLNIQLSKKKNIARTPDKRYSELYSVSTLGGRHLGDIYSEGMYFTEVELRRKIAEVKSSCSLD